MNKLFDVVMSSVTVSLQSIKVQIGALKGYFILTAVVFAILEHWIGRLLQGGFSFSLIEWIFISVSFIIPVKLITSDLSREKELGTLSTLLYAPVSRTSILLGKLLAEAIVWAIYLSYLLMLAKILMPEALQALSFEELSNFFIQFWALGVAFGSIGLFGAVISKTAFGADLSAMAVFLAGISTVLGYIFLKTEVEPLAHILLYLSPFTYAIDGAIYPLLKIGPVLDVLALFGFMLFFLFISAVSFERQDIF